MNQHSNSYDSLIMTLQNFQKEFSTLEKEHSILLQFFKQEKDLTSFQRLEIESLKKYKRSLLELNRRLLEGNEKLKEENENLKEDAKREEGRKEMEKVIKVERVKQKKNQYLFLIEKINSILDEYQNFFEQVEGPRLDIEKMTSFLKNEFSPCPIPQFPSFQFPKKSSSLLPSSPLPPTTVLPSILPHTLLTSSSLPPPTLSPTLPSSTDPPALLFTSFLNKDKKEEKRKGMNQYEMKREEEVEDGREKEGINNQKNKKEDEKEGNRERCRKDEEEGRTRRENQKGRREEEEECKRTEKGEKEDGYGKLADLATQIFSKQYTLHKNLHILARLSINSYFWGEIQRKKQEIQATSLRIFEKQSFIDGSLLKLIDESWMSDERMGEEEREGKTEKKEGRTEEGKRRRAEEGGRNAEEGERKAEEGEQKAEEGGEKKEKIRRSKDEEEG